MAEAGAEVEAEAGAEVWAGVELEAGADSWAEEEGVDVQGIFGGQRSNHHAAVNKKIML